MIRVVDLHAYDPAWAAAFEREAAALKPVFGEQLVLIEHIGSTAIPGIKAKPIIDILIAVQQIDAVEALIPAMDALGYEHRGESGIPGRQYFRKEMDNASGYHVHIYQHENKELALKLDFRDYLRAHPDRALAYSQLKEDLAVRYREDRATYTESKTDFIRETNQLAAEWRQGK